MGITGCYTQSFVSPFIPPDTWCEKFDPENPYCHDNNCVECIDRGCPIERPFCVNFKCVECEEDQNCWEGMTCSPEGKCVGAILYCSQAEDPDSWCVEHEGLPKCNLGSSKCAECVIDFDCLDSAKPYCDSDVCVECKGNEHCPLGTKCDLNECIEGCDDDLGCPPGKPYCSQKTGKCEECWSSQHCPDGYGCDNYQCVWEGCNGDDSKCPLDYYCVDDKCIEGCKNPNNCSPGKPYCSAATGGCEACLANQHCAGDDYVCYNYECVHKDNIPEEHPVECEYPSDCGTNWTCIYGKCYEGCSGNAFCGPDTSICSYENAQTIWQTGGMGTTYGQCVECETPEDCNIGGETGYICSAGVCVLDIPEAEKECENDIECPGVCVDFKCVECRDKTTCPTGWDCDNNKCVKGCGEAEDCPADLPICSGALGYCVECTGKPHCPDGYDCDDYQCVWAGCEGNDSLCSLGFWCDIDECIEGCQNSNNCPPGKPYCSQKTGKCEECWSSQHCPDGYGCDDYQCVWVGIACGGDDSKCPKGEWCPADICVEGCSNDANCPGDRPHCSQATGKCEECFGHSHCGPGQNCVDYHCMAIEAECIDKYDCDFGERCKNGTCIKIECYAKTDCDAGEWCDDGVCRSYTDECGTGCADGYFCNTETNKCERIECKTSKDCSEGECCETITGVNMCVPCEAAKCDALHGCKAGWTCDLSTGLCKPKSCASPAGCPNGYICDELAGECVPINCVNTSNPDGYCSTQFGTGWICDIGAGHCVKVTCDLVADPDAYCHEYYGPTYGCKGDTCVELGYYDYASPDDYCKAYNGEYWHWNIVSGTCEITPCNLYDDPDGMCADYKGEWYTCIGGTCSKLSVGDPCAVSNECGPGLKCKYGFCHEIECEESWECTGENETCVDGLCIATTHDCVIPGDCDPGYFCNNDGRCEKRVCDDNIDCPLDYCCLYSYAGDMNSETQCIPCGEFSPPYPADCPEGWLYDMKTGLCTKQVCDSPEECGPGYDCINGYCVAFNCATAEDPLSFCQKWWGEYTYCNLDTARCEERKCNDYPHPRDICEEQLGEKFKCDWSTGECCYKDASDFANPDLYCQKMNGSKWWYWDAEQKKCRLPTCDAVYNPDAFCEDIHGSGYRCVQGKCKRGNEGDACEIPEDCGLGFTCGVDGICVKKECYTEYDCGPGRWCDKGICKDDDNLCENNADCRDGYFCNLKSKRCHVKECKVHADCGGTSCCFDGWCIPCAELPCELGGCPDGWECVKGYCSQRPCEWDHECPKGFYCDITTGKCVQTYESEITRKCQYDSDCYPNEICVGAGIEWSVTGGKPLFGLCIDKGREWVTIMGVIDDKTCDYCLYKIGNIYYLDEVTLPPYHKHCRCWPEIHKHE